MELLQLKYFKAVAETGKIVTAAEALYISPPALSASVSRLERELGMKLFDRENNRIILNTQGKILLRYVNQVLGNLECARIELRQSLLAAGQHVSIAVTTSNLWIDLIAAFSQDHPHFTLASTTLKISQIRNGGFQPQYAFLLAEENDIPPDLVGELDSLELFCDQPALMVHPNHPLAALEAVELGVLTGETLFLPMQDQSLYERLVRLFAENGLPLPASNSYSHSTCRSMVSEGLGVAFTTMHASRLDASQLRYIPITGYHRPWIMRLYWRKKRELTEDDLTFLRYVGQFYGVVVPY